jgi:hypothetical protein
MKRSEVRDTHFDRVVNIPRLKWLGQNTNRVPAYPSRNHRKARGALSPMAGPSFGFRWLHGYTSVDRFRRRNVFCPNGQYSRGGPVHIARSPSEWQMASPQSAGHAAPVAIHSRARARNSSRDTGGGRLLFPERSIPGDQAHCTRSVSRCGTNWSGSKPPCLASKIERQSSATLRPSQAILRGARCQSGAPGTPVSGELTAR